MERNEILRIYGKDYKENTKRLLKEAKLCDEIKTGARIGIKPNLVSPVPAEFGATTHPEIVAGLIEYLQENGFFNIVIMEGSWVGDKTEESFDICGYCGLAEKYNVELTDTQKESFYLAGDGENAIKICSCVKNVDFLINVPVLKGHCQTNITCALKNMKGLIPNSEKRRFHSMGLNKPIGMLNGLVKQDFILVDHICGDLDSEGGGSPVSVDCIMAAKDPVLTDSFVCKLMGYELKDVPYIEAAESAGAGSSNIENALIVTIDDDGTDHEAPVMSKRKIFKLKDRVQDVETCSACYESLMEALLKLDSEGLTESFKDKIHIGQGNKKCRGKYGIGNCTSGFDFNIPGCPPDSEDIYEGIKKWIKTN